MIIDTLLTALPLALVPAAITFVALARLERLPSDEDTARIALLVAGDERDASGARIDAVLDELAAACFSARRGVLGALLRTMRYTIASLAVFLFAYAYRTPDIVGEITSGRALPQILLLGVLPTFAANLVVFLGHGRRAEAGLLAQELGAAFLLGDLLRRAGVFVLLTVLTFVPFSMLLGSTLDSSLASVLPTLGNALVGRSLMSVYFCSLLLSSMPLLVLALVRRMAVDDETSSRVLRAFYFADFQRRPLLASSLVVASLVTAVAYVVAVVLLLL